MLYKFEKIPALLFFSTYSFLFFCHIFYSGLVGRNFNSYLHLRVAPRVYADGGFLTESFENKSLNITDSERGRILLLQIGMTQLNQGNSLRAIESLSLISDVSTQYLLNLGDIAYRNGESATAKHYYEIAHQIEPSIKTQLRFLNIAMLENNADRVRLVSMLAEILKDDDQRALDNEIKNMHTRFSNQSYWLFILLGEHYYNNALYGHAEDSFRNAHSLHTGAITTFYLGRFYFETQQLDTAINILENLASYSDDGTRFFAGSKLLIISYCKTDQLTKAYDEIDRTNSWLKLNDSPLRVKVADDNFGQNGNCTLSS